MGPTERECGSLEDSEMEDEDDEEGRTGQIDDPVPEMTHGMNGTITVDKGLRMLRSFTVKFDSQLGLRT